jgi:hypothetical protein
MALIRNNLASRPFYNERLVSLGLILGLVIVLALTAFNLTQILSLTAERSVFKAEQEKDDREAAAINAGADAVRRSVDQVKLSKLVRETREANELIDQRTFSWTVFFNHIEQTMPIDARLMSVEPRVERGEFLIGITVNGRTLENIEDFTDHLLATGVFYDVALTRIQGNEDSTTTATLLSKYYLAPTPPKTTGRTTGPRGR